MANAFHLLDAPKCTADIWPWDAVLGRYSRIIGYTFFGDFLALDPISSEHAVLVTLKGYVAESGYDNTEAFVQFFLGNPRVVTDVLRPQLLESLAIRLGPLGTEEVYFPGPYPSLGGSGAPETYQKGNVWVFASLAGQSR